MVSRLITRYKDCAPGCVSHPSDQFLVRPMEIGLILNFHVLFIVGNVFYTGSGLSSVLIQILHLILMGLVKLQVIKAAIL